MQSGSIQYGVFSMFWAFQTLLCQQLICPSHVAIARLISVTVLSLQTRLCFLSVTSLSLHRTRTRVSVPLLSLQCAIVTWQKLCNDSNSSRQVCDGKSEIGHYMVWFTIGSGNGFLPVSTKPLLLPKQCWLIINGVLTAIFQEALKISISRN